MRKLAAICALLLTGCVSAPVTPPGPMLPKGPLHGRLEQGVYRDMRSWFGVAAPIAPDDPDYGYLQVTEQYQPNISYAAFVPSKNSGEYYRVFMEDLYAGNRPLKSLDNIADGIVTYFENQVVREREEPLSLVEERPWHTARTSGVLRLYTEKVPSVLVMQNLGMAEDYTAYILAYLTVEDGKAAFMWMEWPEGCGVCLPIPRGPATASEDPIDKALAADARSGAFMASFHFGND